MIDIRIDDLAGPEIAALLQEHLALMHLHSPPESVHALGLARLKDPAITVWTAWGGAELLGCAALKELDPRQGEIKSMRTASAHLRRGVARALLDRILGEARRRGYAQLWLETGSGAPFAAAHALYEGAGFVRCGPFADYVQDPFAVFMTRAIDRAKEMVHGA